MNVNKVLKHEAKGALFSALPSSREDFVGKRCTESWAVLIA